MIEPVVVVAQIDSQTVQVRVSTVGEKGADGSTPSGTGYVKVSSGVLQTPSATIPAADVSGITTATQTALDSKVGLDVQSVLDSVNSQPYTAAKIAGWTTGGGGTAAPVRMLILGDSLISVGGGFPLGPNMGPAGIIGLQTYNTSGTVTNHTPPINGRLDYWINGKATTLAVGATAQFTNGGSATGDIRGDKACIAYIKQSGGGSFVLQYASNGTGNASGASDTGWTTLATIDTSNASMIGVYAEYDLPTTNSPFYRLRVKTVTTGSVAIVTTGIYNSNGGGVIHMPIANVQGLDITDALTTSSAVFNPIWTGLAPDLVFSLWADTNTAWDSGGAWRTFYANAKALRAATDWVQISRNISYEDNAASWATSTSYALNALVYATVGGVVVLYRCSSAHTSGASTQPGVGANWATVWNVEAPQSAVETSSAVYATSQAASQRAWALSANETFINGAALFGSTWANANTKGLMGDVVHPSAAGVTLRNMHIWSKLPVGNWFLGGGWRTGLNEPDLNAAATSGNILGQAMEFLRSFTIRAATGALRLFDQTALMDNSKTWSIFANTSQLRFNQGSSTGGYFDLGSGLAGFYPGGNNWALGSTSARWNAFTASFSAGIVTKTAAYTATGNDYTILCDATSGAFAITLPSASSHSGRIYIIKKTDASGNAVTITGTVDGTINPTLTSQWQTLRIQSNGTNYTDISATGIIPITSGGTGATSAAAAWTGLGGSGTIASPTFTSIPAAGPIGATTASTGAFTTLTASGITVTGAGTTATFTDSSTSRSWRFTAGNLLPVTSNVSSFGGSGNRIATGYFTNLDASGTLAVTGTTTATGGLILGSFTVAAFPSTTHLMGVVTDALAPVVGAAVAAGGSAKCIVCYNGTAKIVTALL